MGRIRTRVGEMAVYLAKPGNRERRCNTLKSIRQRLRIDALTAYSPGGIPRCACAKCPENSNPHLAFLEIDHLNGDGAAHRKTIKGGTFGFLYWLRDNSYPTGFQVLCKNCNGAKSDSLDHRCPHEDD